MTPEFLYFSYQESENEEGEMRERIGAINGTPAGTPALKLSDLHLAEP